MIWRHVNYQNEIEDAFKQATRLLNNENEALTLMTVWMLSEVASDPFLAQYIIKSIVQLSKEASPNTKPIIVYAIKTMLSEEQARNYFRYDYLVQEVESNNLEMLFHSQEQQLDIIQQLYDIQLEDNNAP